MLMSLRIWKCWSTVCWVCEVPSLLCTSSSAVPAAFSPIFLLFFLLIFPDSLALLLWSFYSHHQWMRKLLVPTSILSMLKEQEAEKQGTLAVTCEGKDFLGDLVILSCHLSLGLWNLEWKCRLKLTSAFLTLSLTKPSFSIAKIIITKWLLTCCI